MNYEKEISKLIPEAANYANQSVKREDYEEMEKYGAEWNRQYFDKMDELAANNGIRYTRKYRRQNDNT